MIHIIIGALAIVWSLSRIWPNWMFVADVLKVLLSLALIMFGVIALSAGLRRLKTSD